MKLHIGGLMLVLFPLVLPMAAQDSGNTIDPAYKKIVWNNTTVTLTGPIGTGDAPTVLQVTGGMGGPASMGSGIQLTAGDGGGSHPNGPDGGDGGSIALRAGQGGYCACGSGTGGSITLQPGGSRDSQNGRPGNLILALPSGGGVGVGTPTGGHTGHRVRGHHAG